MSQLRISGGTVYDPASAALLPAMVTHKAARLGPGGRFARTTIPHFSRLARRALCER